MPAMLSQWKQEGVQARVVTDEAIEVLAPDAGGA
jgi:hypothetical protein